MRIVPGVSLHDREGSYAITSITTVLPNLNANIKWYFSDSRHSGSVLLLRFFSSQTSSCAIVSIFAHLLSKWKRGDYNNKSCQEGEILPLMSAWNLAGSYPFYRAGELTKSQIAVAFWIISILKKWSNSNIPKRGKISLVRSGRFYPILHNRIFLQIQWTIESGVEISQILA